MAKKSDFVVLVSLARSVQKIKQESAILEQVEW